MSEENNKLLRKYPKIVLAVFSSGSYIHLTTEADIFNFAFTILIYYGTVVKCAKNVNFQNFGKIGV